MLSLLLPVSSGQPRSGEVGMRGRLKKCAYRVCTGDGGRMWIEEIK